MNHTIQPEQNNSRPKDHRTRAMIFGMTAIALGVLIGIAVLKQDSTSATPQAQDTVLTQSPNGELPVLSKSEPKEIIIDRIKVRAPIIELGLQKDRTIEVPETGTDVGWYKYGPTPGENGASVLVGHLDTPEGAAVFYNLEDLEPGDTVTVTRADNTEAVFKVTSKEAYFQNSFPTQRVYSPTSYPSLRLITCEGEYLEDEGHYSKNLVVYADLIRAE